jgi:hypothetical protein
MYLVIKGQARYGAGGRLDCAQVYPWEIAKYMDDYFVRETSKVHMVVDGCLVLKMGPLGWRESRRRERPLWHRFKQGALSKT